jgi:single-stranded DNA-binding protein
MVKANLITKKKKKTGELYVSFSIAVNKGSGENKKVYFLNCFVSGDKQTESIVKAKVGKGSQIYISGELIIEDYEKDDKKNRNVQVRINNWTYVSSSSDKPKSDGAPQTAQTDSNNSAESGSQNESAETEVMEISEDDLPF